MKKILFVSSSRADFGLMRDVIIETQKMNKKTFLMVTGSHLSNSLETPFQRIKKYKIKNIIKKKLLDSNFKDSDVSSYVAKSINLTSDVMN